MAPDFNKKTVSTIAKRAAFKCSNPDCRISTIGPNTHPDKSTLIGEAAHIFGARPGSKRYLKQMIDSSRASITNAIWLCRNCHKLVDTDENRFNSEILFAWREEHERYVSLELGGAADKIQYNQESSRLIAFENHPSIIRRIIRDKPPGWEWSLTAELMRYYNNPLFRKMRDLREGLYVKTQINLKDHEVHYWVEARMDELKRVINPIEGLMKKLSKSWGEIGEEGDVDEIHHITQLIKHYLEQIIQFEEKIYFVNVPLRFKKLISMLKNILSSQAEKLADVPKYLEEVLLVAKERDENKENEPLVIKKIIEFNLPKKWSQEFNKEYKKALSSKASNNEQLGLIPTTIILFVVIFLMRSCI
ncbi:hypothetical protein [Marinicella sp. W31]|uniref:hypothetical protein n=1 Tax=Marinicella sp. W31 TaxID=3023713 RepID=UPI003757C77C